MTSVNEAHSIFTVLDDEKNGYITVGKFISAFQDFYKDKSNQNNDENTLKSLIAQMHPDEEGRIYFENFQYVFHQIETGTNIENKGKKYPQYSIRRFLSAENDQTSDGENSDIDEQSTRVPESKKLTVNDKHSIHSDYKIPINRLASSCRNLNVSTLLPSAASRARELLSAGASPRDSEVHSDILYHEIGNNFDYLQMEMRSLQEKIESFHSDQNNIDTQQSKRLKEDNTILTRRLNNLEDNLRELEERAQNRLTEEKKDLKLRFTRVEDEKKLELESLHNRLFKLEADSADLSLEIRQYKDESEKLRAEKHALTESLADSDTKLNSLQESFEGLRSSSKLEVEHLKKERDEYEKIILELHDKGKATTSDIFVHHQDIGEISSRHRELESLVEKLREENRQLSVQLEDAHKDLYQRAVRDGENLRDFNDELHRELERHSKEELMDILVKEKDANFKLKDYIEKIIVKVMERHPALLEVAGAAK